MELNISMKTYLDCYPCLLRQALSAARRAGASENQQHNILLKTMEELSAFPSDSNPAAIGIPNSPASSAADQQY